MEYRSEISLLVGKVILTVVCAYAQAGLIEDMKERFWDEMLL